MRLQYKWKSHLISCKSIRTLMNLSPLTAYDLAVQIQPWEKWYSSMSLKSIRWVLSCQTFIKILCNPSLEHGSCITTYNKWIMYGSFYIHPVLCLVFKHNVTVCVLISLLCCILKEVYYVTDWKQQKTVLRRLKFIFINI